MAAPKRTTKQRQYDRAILPRLIREGWSTPRIAEEFGVSVEMITVDFKVVMKQIAQDLDGDRKEMVHRKLMELEELKVEARKGWQKSWEDAQRKEVEYALRSQGKPTVMDGGRLLFPPGKMKKVRELQETSGSLPGAQYLKIIFDCIKAERELLGLDAPKTAVITGTMTWDTLVQGLPKEAVPDEIESEIQKVLGHQQQIAPGIVETNGHHEP